MKRAVLLFVLFSLFGCGKFGRQLFGVHPEERDHYIYMDPHVETGAVESDYFAVAIKGLESARYVNVKLCRGNSIVELPLTVNGKNVCWEQFKGFVIVYNAKSGLPDWSVYRIEYVF